MNRFISDTDHVCLLEREYSFFPFKEAQLWAYPLQRSYLIAHVVGIARDAPEVLQYRSFHALFLSFVLRNVIVCAIEPLPYEVASGPAYRDGLCAKRRSMKVPMLVCHRFRIRVFFLMRRRPPRG